MINSTSVKTRFIVSVASNSVRAVIAFFSGILIARGLNPSGYGDMMFLLGSFVAVRSLMDIGSSSAFYTFISQRPRSRRFYLYYFGWLALQFVIPVLMVTVLMPEAMIAKIWLGHSRTIILLAFTATFMQQQVWQTLSQIGESSRKTVRVQIIGMAVGIGHLILVFLLLAYGLMSVRMVFWLLIGEYPLAALWAFRFLRGKKTIAAPDEPATFSVRSMLREYWIYCKPLALLSLVTFLYEFADRWLLQRFGGASQQGFYQIAYQFATVSLLATTSILNVFWKEIAEANARQDKQRLAALFHKVSRSLVMLGAVLSGFLIPWTDQIVTLILGKPYIMAVPVLAIMFLYPIHQSMGQIGGTMLLAGGYTKAYMTISVTMMLFSLPLSYFVQAPAHGALIPGLGLGAIGMALKMVLVNIVVVNILAWVIARNYGWRFDWVYQVVGIGATVGIGYLVKLMVGTIWNIDNITNKIIVLPFVFSGIFYVIAVACLIWLLPWLVGMDRIEMKNLLRKLKMKVNEFRGKIYMKILGNKCKKIIKKYVPFLVYIYNLIPPEMQHPVDSYRRKQHFKRLSAKEVFTEIYQSNMWEGSESLSGGGSNLINTEVIRSELPQLLFDLGAKSLFDIPCGDFNWMKHVNLDSCTYIGADIVEDLIICNNEKFGGDANGRRMFLLIDVTHDPLPTVDLILCRDCLVHLSFEDIFKALKNIKASNSKYLLTTTYTRRTSNKDILTGEWRPLNLQIHPFNFPAPLRIINENYNNGGGRYSDKSLGLWKIRDLFY